MSDFHGEQKSTSKDSGHIDIALLFSEDVRPLRHGPPLDCGCVEFDRLIKKIRYHGPQWLV